MVRWVERWVRWADSRRHLYFDFVRIYMGVALFVKGLQFVSDRTYLEGVLTEEMRFVPTALTHYIPAAHLSGGFLLTIGLLTRFAAAIQIPVLFGATFVVYMPQGFFTYGQNFEFAALVLFLLVMVFLYGGGRLSADYYLFGPGRLDGRVSDPGDDHAIEG
ncbi:MAG TPA: DoxX family protein [Candidatus Polarisedimenticolaceae bacterium]|nr:DoxX family protein [Candidatus Polarisedimenticolaceae bacterium]